MSMLRGISVSNIGEEVPNVSGKDFMCEVDLLEYSKRPVAPLSLSHMLPRCAPRRYDRMSQYGVYLVELVSHQVGRHGSYASLPASFLPKCSA